MPRSRKLAAVAERNPDRGNDSCGKDQLEMGSIQPRRTECISLMSETTR